MLQCLPQKGLGSAASFALQSICEACREHMPTRIQGLLKIAENLDSYTINTEAALGFLKGMISLTTFT